MYKRGKRSNEARMRRIEQRKKKIIESMRFYRICSETIPKDGWKPARSTHRETRASKAGEIMENKTWGRTQWKKDWHSQSEPVKYDDETRVYAPKWQYARELKVTFLNVRGMREITKREQVVTYMKKNSIDLLCLQETKIPSSSIEQRDNYIYIYMYFQHRKQEEQTTMEWAFAITERLNSTEIITSSTAAT